jgi:hypothetical protein
VLLMLVAGIPVTLHEVKWDRGVAFDKAQAILADWIRTQKIKTERDKKLSKGQSQGRWTLIPRTSFFPLCDSSQLDDPVHHIASQCVSWPDLSAAAATAKLMSRNTPAAREPPEHDFFSRTGFYRSGPPIPQPFSPRRHQANQARLVGMWVNRHRKYGTVVLVSEGISSS